MRKIAISALIGISAAKNCQSGVYSITNTYTRFSQSQQEIAAVNDIDCWEKWTGWSACEGLCGQSVKTANRRCRGGIPGVEGCQGNEIRRKRCSSSERVYGQATESYCPYWSFWAEWTSCHVERNADPCVLPNTQGSRQRTRTCHDPYASLKGETPDCSGLGKNGVGAVEYSSCINPAAYGKTPLQAPIYAPNSDWSACSVNCGSGKRTRTLAHQCANREDTWVRREEWFQQEEQVCVGIGEAACQCCMAGEWKNERIYDVCTGGQDIMTRVFTSISIQGCRQECFARIGAGEVIFNQNTNQWTETRVTIIPIQPNCENQLGGFDIEQGWGACIPQPSPWNPSVMTTCDGRGSQRRHLKHYCADTCRPGDLECVWLQPPCSNYEERSCGPARTTEYIIRCNENGISATGHYVCERRSFCSGDAASMVVDVLQISNGMCGPHVVPPDVPMVSGPFPEVCGCSTNTKSLKTMNNKCHSSTQQIMCPPLSDFCAWGEYTEAQALIQARADGRCVCWADSRYFDEKFEQCTKQAENGEICSSYRTDKRETRRNNYQQKVCESTEIQCEPCTRTCQMQDQGPEVRKCWKHNLCNPSDPMDRIPVPDQTCQQQPPCCYETYETLIQDCQYFQCPSDIGVSTNKQVYEIRYTNPNCQEVRTREVMCAPPACPMWPAFPVQEQLYTIDTTSHQRVISSLDSQQWTSCSWQLEDGTICGGNRKQSRRYPCPNDAGPSGACSAIAPNGAIETKFDGFSETHHSEFCWNLHNTPENMLRVARYEGWSEWVRIGCEHGMMKFERTQSVTNICTGEQMVHLFKTEYRTEVVHRPEPIAECCTAEICPGVGLNPCAPTVTKIKSRTLRRRNRSKRKTNDMSDYPRMVVSRSLKNIQAQIIDDFTGKTLVSVTSSDKSIRADIGKAKGKTEQSKIVGTAIAKKAKEKKIKQVWFDRNGYPYTGRVRAMADAARKTGLKF